MTRAATNAGAVTGIRTGTPHSRRRRTSVYYGSGVIDVARYAPAATLALVVAAALALRLYGLDREGYWGDEYLQVLTYDQPLHYTVWHAMTRHGFGPPDFVIGWFVHRIDPSVWMTRLPAALWATASILVLGLIVRRISTWRAAIFASLLLSVCRMHLVLSQEARPYSICVAFILLTLWMLMRAWERPARKRLVAYAVVALAGCMTRSFIPCVVLATVGLVLSAMLVRQRIDNSRQAPERTARSPVRPLWWATMAAGVTAAAWVLFMLLISPRLPTGISMIVGGEQATGIHADPYDLGAGMATAIARNGGAILVAIGREYGVIASLFACAGVGVTWYRRRELSPSARCVLAVMLFAAPVVALVFSMIGGPHKFYDRYSFFVMPFVACFAGLALDGLLTAVRRWPGRESMFPQFTAVTCLIACVAHPVYATAVESQSFRRIDWRGAARMLAPDVGADDVVAVLTDVPFGLVQQRFFGKYEWPSARPLGEAMWTFAVSDSHFARLVEAGGRCAAVVARPVDPQPATAYLSQGLAEVPPNWNLAKFRGLDVITLTTESPQQRAETLNHLTAYCAFLADAPLRNESVRAVPLTLMARLLMYRGDHEGSLETWRRARSYVPESRLAYFDSATAACRPDR